MLEEGRVVTVRMLLKGLYEKACQQKLWGLVRHTAGMLGKRVEDLAKAVTDLLVRQKQVRRARLTDWHLVLVFSFFTRDNNPDSDSAAVFSSTLVSYCSSAPY